MLNKKMMKLTLLMRGGRRRNQPKRSKIHPQKSNSSSSSSSSSSKTEAEVIQMIEVRNPSLIWATLKWKMIILKEAMMMMMNLTMRRTRKFRR
jgi:hypothetical protein